jgi:hypothetical protein
MWGCNSRLVTQNKKPQSIDKNEHITVILQQIQAKSLFCVQLAMSGFKEKMTISNGCIIPYLKRC